MRRKLRIIQHRRRREGKTDYRKRLKLLLSKKPRFVVRILSKTIVSHVSIFSNKGDITKIFVDSRKLKNYGWKFSFKNLPAAYLTGLLLGIKARKMGIIDGVLDIGLHKPTKGSKVFAFLKGLLDAGISIPHNNSIIPEENRLKGLHIVDYSKKLKEDKGTYRKQFSSDVSKIPEIFEDVKNKIMKSNNDN